jgi:hypothetical protein
MKHLKLLLTIVILLGLSLPLLAQPQNFNTSLHKTRNGKATWYNTENGGFESLTSVPIEDLGCIECHDAVDANGEPYPTDYEPDCVDCHATNSGTPGPVTETDCLGCHGREAFIIGNASYSDVHRDASTPFVCWDCHGTTDMHGDGSEPESMFDDGGLVTDCAQSGCHETIASNNEHNIHSANIHCTSCHQETSLSCYNCHFESQVEHHVKRAKMKITGFTILVNRTSDGKVHPATFQSLSYDGNTWIAMGPSTTHTIIKEGARTCSDCHANMGGNIPAIEEYNNNGLIQFASWNSSDSTLSWLNGVVPLPADYKRSFKLDFIQFDGDWSSPPGTDNKNWSFVKGEADGFQLLYATPLTTAQMNSLGMDTLLVGVEEESNGMPDNYRLEQNYPNPFNPSTTIKFSIPEKSTVQLTVYNQIGELIQTLVNEDKFAGTYEIEFNGQNMASGVYFYQIKANNFVSTKKLVFLK